jgi:hypothetical protein
MTVSIKHVSVDCESWGVDPGDDIRSIGAFHFDPMDPVLQKTEENTFYMACDNPLMGSYSSEHYTQKDLDYIDGPNRKYDLKRNPKTVGWWHSQSDELQDAFLYPSDLKDTLVGFSDFLYSISEDVRDDIIHDIRIWSHGAAFDPPMVKAAYKACGLTYPLFYRSPRDTRTLFDDAGIKNHSSFLERHRMGPLHHALYDSFTQANAVQSATFSLFVEGHSISSVAVAALEKIADLNIIRDSLAQREIAQTALEEISLMNKIIENRKRS